MSNEQQKQQTQELTVKYQIDNCDILLTPSIVQKYIVGGNVNITVPEFKFFTELCRARKLNPFLKEAYCVKYSDSEPAQIVVSKDVILKRAIQHPMYDGKETGVVVIDKDGKVVERQGLLVLDGEKLVGGWARVFRKDKSHPEFISVSLDEVAGRKSDGRFNKSWDKKPATMVEKVAKVRALREAFTDEFSGMDMAPDDIEPPVVIDITPHDPNWAAEQPDEAPKNGTKRMSLDDIK